MTPMTFPRPAGRRRTTATSAALALGLLAGLGVAGSAHAVSASTAPVATQAVPAPAAAVEQLAPAAFAARIQATHGKLINVHVPDAGEIPGTAYHIPFDRIVGDKRLPSKHDTEILIYCRSGNMSAVAGKSLIAAGYTRVVELGGGFDAWKADGRPFTPAHN